MADVVREIEINQETVKSRNTFWQLLRLPLLYKVLIANSIIVGIGAFVGTWLTITVTGGGNQFTIELALLFTFVGLVLSAVVNYAVLRAAFQPLAELQKTAGQVRGGDLQARAKPSVFFDPQIEELSSTFNNMLDTLEERNRQIRAASSLVIRAQEDERRRIARELHDETAQSLTAVLLRLKLLEKASTEEELRNGLLELRASLGNTMDEVRELSRSLRPSLLDDQGLVAALDSYVNGLGEKTHYPVTFHREEQDHIGRLPSMIELVCYRVAQEALTNAIKHAQPEKISVRLVLGKLITLTVRDDGVGFDPDHQVSGLGLVGMRERAQLVSGELKIKSSPGNGTEVLLEIPLENWKEPDQYIEK
jgi:two-component system sensor histidine kinase UhpB